MEFELVLDFMPVQIIWDWNKDPIKTKKAMLRTMLNMFGFFGTQE